MKIAQWRHGEGKRSHTLTHVDESQLNKGGLESAIFQTTFVERPNHRMVIKRWELTGTDNDEAAEKICRIRAERASRIYTYFKQMGFPVPTTYRLHETKPEVLMTDLSQNGKSLVLSPNNDLNDNEPIQRGMLSMSECEQVSTEILQLVKKAAFQGIVLGADVFFVIKKRNGEGKPRVMLADFGGCEHHNVQGREDYVDQVYSVSMRKARLSMKGFLKQYSALPESDIESYLDSHGFPQRVPSLWED